MRTKVLVYELVDVVVDESGERLLIGTIEDIRTFIKDRWKYISDNFVTDITGIEVEEDFYAHVDDTKNLFQVMSDMGYKATRVCEVPIEDFMD
jgi:hypothetical protein